VRRWCAGFSLALCHWAVLAQAPVVPAQTLQQLQRLVPADQLQALESLRTDNAAEQRERWGALADLAGKLWVFEHQSLRNVAGFDVRWLVPGSVMKVASFWCYQPGTPCAFDEAIAVYKPGPAVKRLFDTTRDFELLRSNGPKTEGIVHLSDGTVVVYSARKAALRYKFDAATGKGFHAGYDYRVGTGADLERISAFGVEVEAHRIEKTMIAEAEEKAAAPAREARAMAEAESNRIAAEKRAQQQALAEAKAREEAAAAAARLRDQQAARARSEAEAQARAEAAAAARRDQQAALRARFPVVAVGDTKTPVLTSGGDGQQPDIFYLQHEARDALAVEVTSSSFAPLVAIYEVEKPDPIGRATAAVGASARLSADLAADTKIYLVVVQSLDGKAGGYALKVTKR
jgi:hypothetical protein